MSATVSLAVRRRREIRLTRVFDAPRRLVFNALTLPEMIGHWFGPAKAAMEVCEIDLRRGGSFRYVWRRLDGSEVRMSGTFLEVMGPERITAVERFEQGGEAAEFLSTTELEETDGLTRLTRTIRYATPGTVKARLRIADFDESRPTATGDKSVTFVAKLKAGRTRL